jgi:hypothetical protein
MNTTINEIYALISMLLIVIILLFGLGVRFAIKTANATYTNLNNKINTLENITLEKLMLVEEQNKKINDMDETILSLIEQNKLLVKSHYNIVYDINNIQTTISHLTDDTSSKIEELKNIVVSTNEKNEKTHATYILEEQTKIDELKNQLIELSTNICLTNNKITNVENTMVTNEELDDTFNTLTRYLAEIGPLRESHTVSKACFAHWDGNNFPPRLQVGTCTLQAYLIRYNKEFYKKQFKNPRDSVPVYKVEYREDGTFIIGINEGSYYSCASTGEPNINIGVMEGKVIKFGTVLDRVI